MGDAPGKTTQRRQAPKAGLVHPDLAPLMCFQKMAAAEMSCDAAAAALSSL
jgi:hypothetical protein